MAIKMKTLVRASKGSCVLLLVTVLVVSGFAIFQLKSDERQIPVPAIVEWRFELIGLLILCAYAGCFSVIWFYVAGNYNKDDKYTAVLIVLTLFVAFFAGVYLSIDDHNRSKLPPVSMSSVFNATKNEILKGKSDGKGDMWTPEWLNAIQEASKNCCGIIRFMDYDEFWSPIQDNVPKSCCRSTGDKSNCHTYLQNIPYPDTVAKNIKVDTGCYLQINQKVNSILNDATILTIVVTLFLGLSAFVFAVEYFCAYCLTNQVVREEENTDPIFRTEEQVWQTLDLFPSKTNNNTSGNTMGVASGETLELENKTTNTDFPDPCFSDGPQTNRGYSVQTVSQQTMPPGPDSVQFIPEVSSPPEFESQPEIVVIDQNQEEIPDEFYPERKRGKERHHRHRRRHRDE